MIKIAIVDDHSLFRLGIKAILSANEDMVLQNDYDSPENFLQKWKDQTIPYDVILADLSFDHSNGFDFIKKVKSLSNHLKVIALTTHKEEFYILNAVEAGVDGYLHKDITEAELISSITKVISGESYYSEFISKVLINKIYKKPKRSNQPFLTGREREVVHHLADGLSTKEIALKLTVSPRTIDAHRYNILAKFGVQNTAELIRRVVEQKIIF